MFQKFLIYAQTARFRLLAILATVVYLAILLFFLDDFFKPSDPMPVFEEVTLAEKANASRVQIGMHINSFPEFCFAKNNFLVDGIIWFKFPSGAESLATIENFSIHNGLLQPSGHLVYKSSPIIKLIDDMVLVSYHVQFTFKANLFHKNFPVSQRTLTMIIHNKNVTPQELCFETSDDALSVNDNILISSWKPATRKAYAGYTRAVLSNSNPAMEISYPAAAFSITFKNVGIRDLISLYFPMFVLFFIALFCLIIDVADASRLSYVATAVPILVLFRMIIDGVSPDVGYSTHVDFVYYLLVFLSLLILLFQTFVILTLQSATRTPEVAQEAVKQRLVKINNNVFLGLLLLLVIFMTYSFIR